MIRFKRVSLQNFQSFGNVPTVIELDTGLTTLILGNNLDIGTEGDSRNAAGKSVIFSAIYWCLFNSGIDDDIKLDGLVNLDNGKHTQVILELEINGDAVRITRERKPNSIELLKNGVPFTLHSTGDTDKDIVALLRMDGEAFKNTYLLDANQKPFMAMKPAPQRDFMERFLETNTLTRRAEALKAIRTEADMEFKLEQARITTAKAYNEQVKTQLQTLAQKATDWSTQRDKSISDLSAKIELLSTTDFRKLLNEHAAKENLEKSLRDNEGILAGMKQKQSDLQHSLDTIISIKDTLANIESQKETWKSQHTDKQQDYRTQIASYDVPSLREVLTLIDAHKTMDTELMRYRNTIDASNRKLEQAQDKLAAAKKNLASLESHTCPYCAQPWHSDTIQAQTTKTQQDVANYTAQIQTIEVELSAVLDAEDSAKAKKAQQAKELAELPSAAECHAQIALVTSLENMLQAAALETNPYITQEQTLLAKLKTLGDYNDLSAHANDSKGAVAAIELSIAGIQKELQAFAALQPKSELIRAESQLGSLKDQRAKLQADTVNPYVSQTEMLEGSIKSVDETKLVELQRKQNHAQMLVKLLTDSKSFVRKNIIDNYVPFLNGKINSYLEQLGSPHIAKINPDLTVELYYFEHEISYGLLSKGEKLRLNFSTSCAFRDLAATFGKTCNLLLIDEYMDAGSDPEFFMRVFQMLSQWKFSIFAISHRTELQQLADKTMTVVKKNRFSSIELD